MWNRRLIVALIVLLWSSPALAQIALVQQSPGNNGFGTTCAATLTATAGNLLTFMWRERDGNAITSVADPTNGNWTVGRAEVGTGQDGAAVYYFANTAAGSITVTVTWSGNTVGNCLIAEWSGALTSSVLGNTTTATQAATTNHNQGSVVAAAGVILAASAQTNDGGTDTSTSGFTALTAHASAGDRQAYWYKITAGETTDGAYTTSNSVGSRGVNVVFLQSGGGGGGCNGGMVTLGAGVKCE